MQRTLSWISAAALALSVAVPAQADLLFTVGAKASVWNAGAKAVACVLLEQVRVRLLQRLQPLPLADRHELHFGCDDALSRVVKLRHRLPGLRPARLVDALEPQVLRRGVASSFLSERAGYDINFSLVDYSSRTATHTYAWLVGTLNTVFFAAVTIVTATLCGLALAMARLSPRATRWRSESSSSNSSTLS